jgi:hypothetical protein
MGLETELALRTTLHVAGLYNGLAAWCTVIGGIIGLAAMLIFRALRVF